MLPSRRPESPSGAASGALDDVARTPAPAPALERAAAATLHRYLRWVAAHCTVAYVDERGEPLDDAAVHARVAALLAPGEPLIATYWISDALAIALLPMVSNAFRALMASLTCVVDDTFAGRVAGRYVGALGGQSTRLGLPGDLERLRQVQTLMRRRASCAFPVDGGGPYRAAGTGIVTLAVTLRATIVPLAACVRPAFPPVHPSRVRLPVPGGRLSVVLGAPLVPAARADRHAEAARVTAALNALHDRLERGARRRLRRST